MRLFIKNLLSLALAGYGLHPASTQTPAAPPKRWPVQILSATYGTGGKDADVGARVKEFVEDKRKAFYANPGDLQADPNPGWNKGLHIVYMKDGVRREQYRNENECVLPESFFGPQDAEELRVWLLETRWHGPEGDIQFHANSAFTSPGSSDVGVWTSTAANKIQLSRPGATVKQCVFDYTWSSFSGTGEDHPVYRPVK